MDLRHFFSVMSRFKYVVAGGFVLACLAAFFSFVKVGPHGLAYRQQEIWSSSANVLVTSPRGGPDPTALAAIYAQYAASDAVKAAALRKDGIPGKLQGNAGFDTTNQTSLPTLTVSGLAASPVKASILANDGVIALKAFIRKHQAGTPSAQRPYISVLQRAIPFTANVFTPRSKTPPVFAFVLVIAATLGLAFLLENLRPRVRAVPDELDVEVPRASGAARQARNN